MSSIVIAGDTSGTCTLQANAVAGTTTLTLPTSSGALVVGASAGISIPNPGTSANVLTSNGSAWVSQAPAAPSTPTTIASGTSNVAVVTSGGNVTISTNGSQAMLVDTSQNVGIGTASPGVKLDLNGGDFRIQQSASTARQRFIAGSNQWNVEASNSSNTWGVYDAAAGTSNLVLSGSNLQFNSGYGSVATAYGCRAWVNFAGSSASIRGSGNVSSVSRLGGGIYTINMTNALVDANYAICGSCSTNGSYGIVTFYANSNNNTVVTPTTTAFTVSTGNPSIGNFDSTYVMISIFR